MQWVFEQRWVLAVFLVACRLGPLFILTPVFGSSQLPVRVRVLLALALSALMVAGMPSIAPVTGSDFGEVFAAALVELVIGMAIAFGLLAVFAAFAFGGRLLDLQVGFGVANLFDPVTRGHAPLLGTALSMLAVVVFFALNGHYLVLRALAASLQSFPPGGSLTRLNPQAIIAQFGIVFSYGLVIVAPAVFALLLLDVCFALLSRTMPQMNVFVVSMPLKVIVGLAMLALSMNHLLPAMRRVFDTLPSYWQRVLGV